MHRAIGAVSHGIIDYFTVIILAIGPHVAHFDGRQATFCYILAAVHLILTLVTRFPLGVLKLVGLPIHGAIEMIVGVLMIVMPWIANFSAGVTSRNFFICIGALILVIWYLTDYRGIRDRVPPVADRASAPK